MSKNICVLVLFLLGSFYGRSTDYSQMKIAVDAMTFYNSLYALTSSGTNPKAEAYRTRLETLLDDLGRQGTGFRKDSFPVDLNVSGDNSEYVAKICTELDELVNEIRDFVEIAKNQFAPNQLDILRTLLSKNPGDYYMGINPNFEFDLHNHPQRLILEEIQLQDIGFEDIMASGDSALWNIAAHCPNLESIVLFGAELTNENLARMKLHQIKKLKILELSENQLSILPVAFNKNNTLEFLSLRRNGIAKMPSAISEWTNLKYLDLRNNQIDQEERGRIKRALPNAKIDF